MRYHTRNLAILVSLSSVALTLLGCWPVSKVVDKRFSKGPSSLHEAARDGDLDRVKVELQPKKGTQPNINQPWEVAYQKGLRKWTPLMYAANGGHVEVTRYLLDEGATVNARDHFGETALSAAIGASEYGTAELLLERGADPNLGSMAWGPPILRAIRAGDMHSVQLLLRYGVDPSRTIRGERTPIETARYHKQDTILAVLIERQK